MLACLPSRSGLTPKSELTKGLLGQKIKHQYSPVDLQWLAWTTASLGSCKRLGVFGAAPYDMPASLLT